MMETASDRVVKLRPPYLTNYPFAGFYKFSLSEVMPQKKQQRYGAKSSTI